MPNRTREPLYKKRRDVWHEIVFDLKGREGDAAAQARLEKLELWRRDHWAFLTGRDVPNEEWPKGKPIIWSVDERDNETPVKPFPEDKLYLHEIANELWNYRLVTVDKVRQKYITSLCAQEILWFGGFYEEREIFVSRIKEESAVKLINDKIRTVHGRMPGWMKLAMPMKPDPQNIITFTDTMSTVTAVAQNFGTGDARGPTASLVFVDEAAFIEMYGVIYGAILPMAARLWAVSTANIGNPGAQFFKQQIFSGRPGYDLEGSEVSDESDDESSS